MRGERKATARTRAWGALLACALTGAPAGAQEVLHSIFGDDPQETLGTVSTCGDVDGDGYADAFIGARFDDYIIHNGGSAWVYSGHTWQPIFVFAGQSLYSSFGLALGDVGDVDGDGFPDLAVGAPYADTANGIDSGFLRVYSGRDGAMLHELLSDSDLDKLGYSVAGLGDVDQDGAGDFIVGVPLDDFHGINQGAAVIYSGVTAAKLVVTRGTGEGDLLGTAVSRAGDLDGDGVPDAVVGIPFADAAQPDCGAVRAISGATGLPLYTRHGNAAGDHLGYNVDGGADLDGDGVPDVIAGAQHAAPGGANSGMAMVLSGAAGTLLHTFLGTRPNEYLGTSVAACGDIDGDGRDDLLLTAPGSTLAGIPEGSVRVYRGGSWQFHLGVQWTAAKSTLGLADGAGDVNADGVPDLICGSINDNTGAPQAGMAMVVAGCRDCAFEPAGAGCKAPGGEVPKLHLGGDPTPGGPVAVAIQDAPPAGSAFVLIGAAPASAPLGGGCTLLVAPLLPPIGPLPITNGSYSASMTLPAGTPVQPWWFQAFLTDAGAVLGFTATQAVVMNVH